MPRTTIDSPGPGPAPKRSPSGHSRPRRGAPGSFGRWLPGAFLLAACTIVAAPALAGEVETSVPFQLGEWVDLDAQDGPVTLHRIMIRMDESRVKKSDIFRPGRNSRYTETIEIRLEFSNESTSDWEVQMQLEWKDGEGNVIDGYTSDEGLDDEERYAFVDNDMSTLRYGLEQAETFEIQLRFFPE